MSQASSRLLGAFRMAEPLTSRLPSLPGLPQRLKGGRIERGGKYVFNYWKQVAIDYKAALGEVYTGALAKPKKAALISSFLASCAYMNKTNPTFRDFEDRWREFNILLIGVSEAIRNKVSDII